MQTHRGVGHDGGLDDGDHGLPLDCDDGDGQQPLVGLMPAAVSQLQLRRVGLKLDSEPHTLKKNI